MYSFLVSSVFRNETVNKGASFLCPVSSLLLHILIGSFFPPHHLCYAYLAGVGKGQVKLSPNLALSYHAFLGSPFAEK